MPRDVEVSNAVLLPASGAKPASCGRSLEAACLLFERRVLPHGSPPRVWLAVASVHAVRIAPPRFPISAKYSRTLRDSVIRSGGIRLS